MRLHHFWKKKKKNGIFPQRVPVVQSAMSSPTLGYRYRGVVLFIQQTVGAAPCAVIYTAPVTKDVDHHAMFVSCPIL